MVKDKVLGFSLIPPLYRVKYGGYLVKEQGNKGNQNSFAKRGLWACIWFPIGHIWVAFGSLYYQLMICFGMG